MRVVTTTNLDFFLSKNYEVVIVGGAGNLMIMKVVYSISVHLVP